jgi:hypothetical protein
MAPADFERQREPWSSPRGAVARPVSPQYRPPLALRAMSALLGMGAVAFAVALMLSDRAPGVLRRLFGEDVRRLWDRIDASQRAQFVSEADLPGPDFVIHVVVWAVIVALVGMAIWTWRGLTATAVGSFAGSVVIELAQGRYSDTRSVELSDVVANGVGVAIGTGAVALMYLAWSAVGRTLALIRVGDRHG